MKNLTRIIALLLLVTAAQGCTDILERTEPPTAISQEVALTDEGAIDAIRAGMYSELHGSAYARNYMLGPESLADNLVQRAGTSRNEGYHQNQPGAGMSTWGTAYDMIQKANLLIHAIDEDALSEADRNKFRGEAYFIRALAQWHLVRALGYEPGVTPATGAGAGWDRGIILRTEPTLTATDADFRARSTVNEVYSQVKSDLQQAINLLGQSQEPSRYYIQQGAAYGLLARVHLYERDWAAAESAANSALSSTGASLVTSESGVANMFNENTGMNPEGIFITLVDPSTESLGYNSSLNTYTAQAWVAAVPSQDLLDLYDASDWRNQWYAPCYDEINDVALAGCPAGMEIQKWNGEKGQYADDIPLLRVSEMVLIQAEARLKQNNVAGALTALNTLRNARGLGNYASANTDAIMNEILDERRREFAAEGHRFFDLKRLGRDIRKPPGGSYADVAFNDFRILDNLPGDEIELNSKLEQNPGY